LGLNSIKCLYIDIMSPLRIPLTLTHFVINIIAGLKCDWGAADRQGHRGRGGDTERSVVDHGQIDRVTEVMEETLKGQ
jgi:hypothetical protein